jgi:hypothetical protein
MQKASKNKVECFTTLISQIPRTLDFLRKEIMSLDPHKTLALKFGVIKRNTL